MTVINWHTRDKLTYPSCHKTSISIISNGLQYFNPTKISVKGEIWIICEGMYLGITLLPLKKRNDLLDNHHEISEAFLTKTRRPWLDTMVTCVCMGPETIFISNHNIFPPLVISVLPEIQPLIPLADYL